MHSAVYLCDISPHGELTPASSRYSESCIKGHRSSSCHHTDRPLFEIKKKGRPTSQCERCREARQNRQLHAKCTCDPGKRDAGAAKRPPTKKGKRLPCPVNVYVYLVLRGGFHRAADSPHSPFFAERPERCIREFPNVFE